MAGTGPPSTTIVHLVQARAMRSNEVHGKRTFLDQARREQIVAR